MKELEEWMTFIRGLPNESVEYCYHSGQGLNLLCSPRVDEVVDHYNLFYIRLDPLLCYQVPKEFSRAYPMTHFTAFNLSLCLLSIANTSVKSFTWN